jgi:hypothetical protein
MLRALRLAALLGTAALPAVTQDYQGPAVDACARLARAELTQTGMEVASLKLVQNDIEKYTRNVGAQFVSSILTGLVHIDLPDGKARQARYLCLVADDRTPVFIHLAWEASAQSGATPR